MFTATTAGLDERITAHPGRHTFVNELSANREDLVVVAEPADHARPDTLRVYSQPAGKLNALRHLPIDRRLAAKRVAASGVPVEYIGLDGQALPLETASVDHVVATWTLCTIPDAGRALGEVYRVLRPGGSFHFVDHGRSPDPGVARWQDRLTVLQRRLAGGCHLNRPIGRLVADCGLELTGMANYYMEGPKPFGYMFEGRAFKA